MEYICLTKNEIEKQKIALFTKLKDKGLFWSYSKDMQYDEKLKMLVIKMK